MCRPPAKPLSQVAQTIFNIFGHSETSINGLKEVQQLNDSAAGTTKIAILINELPSNNIKIHFYLTYKAISHSIWHSINRTKTNWSQNELNNRDEMFSPFGSTEPSAEECGPSTS